MTNRSTPRSTDHAVYRRLTVPTVVAAVAFAGLGGSGLGAVATAATPPVPAVETTGTLPDGATWVIRKPGNWNGTLVLYSHGMVAPGEDNPAVDAPDAITEDFLLDHGYALAGSSYATTGFAMREALDDQAAVVGIFRDQVATPDTTIAWGTSLGGAVTAGLLERRPDLFDGGLAMCGVLAGGVGLMDSYLDTLFAVKTLLAPEVDLVHLGDDLFVSVGVLQTALQAAQATPQGRARIALAAAIGDFPGWKGADNPRPAPDDVTTQQEAQFSHLMELAFFGLALGADIEAKTGGNPSTNIGVDYAKLLRHSNGRDEVTKLYHQGGFDLGKDLRSLARADRIAADPAARATLAEISTFTGQIADPMLTLHTAGDQLTVVEQEQAYATTVRRAGNRSLLRQAFTERAAHCAFTPAEMLSALGALTDRVETGRWKHVADPNTLQERAFALGPAVNVHVEDDPTQPIPTDPAFTDLNPGHFPRPFDRA